ncbi:hypothetical protein D3P06_12975 [Paracoccus aestuarii]|uniref:Uncharacterized protein n=1 Tax=Paracoccus aestuarii TaxID=453842 RepID=A0A418ZSS7_9RHOB|nr:T3SS effector HopA1 family protein [Paracoccus aestuarii]RJL00917.1 hypothetical protein D3P06_12975 [Paracoccus aestuarii]WCR00979.1 hypothetical protein JHW48_15665 [Paracoccus aestuarii]
MLAEVLQAILGGLSSRGDAGYRFFGRKRDLTAAPRFRAGTEASRRGILVQALAHDIYARLNEIPAAETALELAHPQGSDGSVLPLRLDQVTAGGMAVLWHGAARMTLAPGRYRLPVAAGRQPRPGDLAQLVPRSLRADAQPGWIYQTAHAPLNALPGRIVRIYLDIAEDRGLRAAEICTEWAEAEGVALAFKHAATARNRRDAMVLYLGIEQAVAMAPELSALCQRLSPLTRGRQAMLTRPLLDGIGYAEDPITGGSFGMSRAVLLADIALAVAIDGAEPETHLGQLCARDGVDAERPWRNACRGPRPVICDLAC